MTPLLTVVDGVVDVAYRDYALGQTFQDIQTGEELWRGIAIQSEGPLPAIVQSVLPGAATRLTFFRKSPEGQPEPNFIHSDEGMGQWTAILYLNPEPAEGDGTSFWRFKPTGDVTGSARELDKDQLLWERWKDVAASYGRLLLFDSMYFHSRAIEANYGHGDDARLVQVAFGTYA